MSSNTGFKTGLDAYYVEVANNENEEKKNEEKKNEESSEENNQKEKFDINNEEIIQDLQIISLNYFEDDDIRDRKNSRVEL